MFPNPASGSLNIELPLATENVLLTIENVTGRIVATKSISTKTSKVHYPIPNILTGIYIVKAFTESAFYSGKLEVNK
ncbi:MAG: T9SS type A sorting domain-containing protein [Taibaiella sp.]|nr:T9SS type A sorting domain-containing protein [Taibaiella sp.]